MRALIAVTVAVLLAGCTTAQPRNPTVAYDHKTNQIRQVAAQPQSEFVGTSARATNLATQKPGWYAFGHP